MTRIKKFKLPRGTDPLKCELRPTQAWLSMVLTGGAAFFAIFLWAYFYFVEVTGLEEQAKMESAAEVLRVVDQEDLRRTIELLELKEVRLNASSTPTVVDPSR